jgi:hypothetical protein
MIVIESSKGAGLAEQAKFVFEAGVIPTRELTFINWCDRKDPQFAEFLSHIKTLV